MKPFSAFLVIIKTYYGKIIALFVDSKFESTRDMEIQANGKKHKEKKLTNN